MIESVVFRTLWSILSDWSSCDYDIMSSLYLTTILYNITIRVDVTDYNRLFSLVVGSCEMRLKHMSTCCHYSDSYAKATGYVRNPPFATKCPIMSNVSLVMIICLKLKYPAINCG